MDKLESALRNLENSDMYPFHMPGHKRKPVTEQLKSTYAWDITEIDGFDNLHHAEGILKEEQEFAADLFGADESFLLVNGSSCGVLAAITAVCEGKERILMSRNAHKSAYNALYLANIKADYLYPERIPEVPFAGPVSVEMVRQALETSDSYGSSYAGIFLTSPTYEGVISDVRGICRIAHEKGIPVIVDEAHGAHLGIWGGDGYFPSGALAQGADIVIQSLHKTLPAMTQTAVLHVRGDLIDRQRLKMHLSMFQSSSPSYILMESMISSLHYCDENRIELGQGYRDNLKMLYREGKKLSRLKVWDQDLIRDQRRRCDGRKTEIVMDPGKIVIGTGNSGLTGKELYDILREKYHLQMEMAAKDYVIAMTSVMDEQKDLERLISALDEIDLRFSGEVMEKEKRLLKEPEERPEALYTIREAVGRKGEAVPLDKSEGKISQEFVYLYPPGIPLIVPGERIIKGMPMYLKESAELGLSVQGLRDERPGMICCID